MKTNRKPTEEQKAAAAAKRAELCRRTAPFKGIVEMNRKARFAEMDGASPETVAKILAGVPAKFRGCYTLNACLEVIYREQTGQTEFHTFNDWKAKGYSVKRGEHGFMLWSTPKTFTIDTKLMDEKGEPVKESIERFALAYVFHAGQVHQDKPAPVEAVG